MTTLCLEDLNTRGAPVGCNPSSLLESAEALLCDLHGAMATRPEMEVLDLALARSEMNGVIRHLINAARTARREAGRS